MFPLLFILLLLSLLKAATADLQAPGSGKMTHLNILGADMNVMTEKIESLVQTLTSPLQTIGPVHHTIMSSKRIDCVPWSRSVANLVSDEDFNFKVVNRSSNVLSTQLGWPEKGLGNDSSQIVRYLEILSEYLVVHEKFTELLILNTDHIHLEFHRINTSVLSTSGLDFTITSESSSEDGKSRISLPANVFENATTDTMGLVLAYYTTSALFPLRMNQNISAIGSPVIAASVARENIANLRTPITITLPLTMESVSNPRCVSWNFNDANGRGNWTESGCFLASVEGNIVICKCSHLTNFGLLVDINTRVSQYEENIPLKTVSIIGGMVSMTGLAIHIITTPIIRRNTSNMIELQKSISIFFMLLSFLVGIGRTEGEVRCTIFSLLIQYFTLVSVAWMGIYACHLYLHFVTVFHYFRGKYKSLMLYILVWGSPAPFLMLSLITLNSGENYLISKGNYCFISHTVVFFGVFMAPILVVVSINTYIIIRVIICIRNYGKRERARTKIGTTYNFKRIKAVRFLVFLANSSGLQWFLGVFTISDASLTFQWLFVIFFSLQGCLIFINECVLREGVRDEWRNICMTSSGARHSTQMTQLTTTH